MNTASRGTIRRSRSRGRSVTPCCRTGTRRRRHSRRSDAGPSTPVEGVPAYQADPQRAWFGGCSHVPRRAARELQRFRPGLDRRTRRDIDLHPDDSCVQGGLREHRHPVFLPILGGGLLDRVADDQRHLVAGVGRKRGDRVLPTRLSDDLGLAGDARFRRDPASPPAAATPPPLPPIHPPGSPRQAPARLPAGEGPAGPTARPAATGSPVRSRYGPAQSRPSPAIPCGSRSTCEQDRMVLHQRPPRHGERIGTRIVAPRRAEAFQDDLLAGLGGVEDEVTLRSDPRRPDGEGFGRGAPIPGRPRRSRWRGVLAEFGLGRARDLEDVTLHHVRGMDPSSTAAAGPGSRPVR